MSSKTIISHFCQVRGTLAAVMISLACFPALATTFTNNTAIGVGNTNYDATDIVISNCTVTIDGPHSFSSVRVASGGFLTHSFSPTGSISNILYVTNEAQVLTGTNLVTLANSNVISGTVAVTDTNGTIVYTNGADYVLSSPDGIVTQMQRASSSTIPDGSTVLVSYQSLLGTLKSGLNLSVTGNVQVDVGGAINADGAGYGGGVGAGAGHSAGSPLDGSGGGYGGIGGTSSSNAVGGVTYGLYAQPTDLGSGGGSGYTGTGGAGGGLIEITAGGALILNGSVSANGANGTNSRSGGGSGGSIFMSGVTLSGSGTLTAKGGAGEPTHGGGGGGGRIAFQFSTSGFAGAMSAYGGVGATIGGAGTVFTRTNGQMGFLIIDNGGQLGTNTTLSVGDGTVNVLVRGNTGVIPTGAWTFNNLTVASNGVLLASPITTLTLNASGAVTVQAGGSIVANGAGYGTNQGGGQGVGHFIAQSASWPCGGGAYGGNGSSGSISNNLGGAAYGTQTFPTGYGSAGGTFLPYSTGGNGGGAIQIATKGIVQVDGIISANGANGGGIGGGGGSGGTISLGAGTLIGSGSILATGGAGAGTIGGGGGGGRIFLNPTANLFSGTISADGGGGGGWGGAGTVFIQISGQNSQLILDNGGNLGTNTPVQSASSTDLIVRNGAIGSSTSATFVNLFVNSNGWLAPIFSTVTPSGPVTFTLTGSATVQAGGGIIADLGGFGPGLGSGAGRTVSSGNTNYCSGAGHGGYGGNSTNNIAIGGSIYDNPPSPSTAGSGGGGTSVTGQGGSFGGPGGGVIRLTVNGLLEMDGVISAAGGNGSGYAGGGGSGGAISVGVGTLAGAGSIAANGGNGANAGGGGAGGMIYVTSVSNLFSGSISAFGGSGANWGGEGIVLTQSSGKNGQLVLDNGGHPGTATPLSSAGIFDVTLRNGAIGVIGSHITVGNLIISSNSVLLATNSSASLQVSTATIQAGGGFIADGYGYPGGQGTGVGHIGEQPNFPCGGGGHGGIGGAGFATNALGGSPYDTQTSPTLMGSGGGSSQGISIGGAGGGVISLTSSGTVQVDGIISANGLSGTGTGGGGGSGGSIKISAAGLTGGGVIAANGGSGAGSIGGGGSGGIIALIPTVNLFAGTVSTYGGGGANSGGAGTIYIQTNGPNNQLIVDNGGPIGGGTPIQTVATGTSILVQHGGAAYQQNPPQTFANLVIGSNAVLEANPIAGNNFPGLVNLTLNQNATIQVGGGIVTDGAGSGANLGTGAGHFSTGSPSNPGSGGGYGGNGGNSSGNLAVGGSVYGSITSPASNGSGGGGSSPASIGGAGGGFIHLTVSGTLENSGKISANGVNGSGLGGGGGSGGSVYVSAGNFVGGGAITANGGRGVDSVGGGGGGGRIYVTCSVDDFVGTTSAQGGSGYAYGGAGTIYTQVGFLGGPLAVQLLVDNGGQAGSTTPLSGSLGLSASPLNLTIQNGAVVSPQLQVAFPVLNNLTIGAGGTLANVSSASTLDLEVLNNVDITPGGVLAVDEGGYGQANGPGMGLTAGGSGSGAGYGGAGGASTTVGGGGTYGSAAQPVDFGSGGGAGTGGPIGGSQGGGAVRLNIGGILNIDGQISSEGGPGIQDNSGGGSGGSIWVTAGMMAGGGTVAADGGDGELYGGGGGGGGRIALYSRTNVFYGGLSAVGGAGDFAGGNGSIVNSNNIPSLQIMSNSPSGITTNAVSAVTLFFNDAPSQSSVTASAVSLTGPNGPVTNTSFTISRLASTSYLLSFPQQTADGTYTLNVGAGVTDLYGQPLVPYSGTFTISLPVIQGTITDTNGHPVAGVVLLGSGGLSSSTTTDTNGNYALGFVPGSSFTVTPSSGSLVFSPMSMSYTSVSASILNQNYTVVGSLAASLKGGINAGNFVLQWQAFSNVNYQIYYSTNLVNWLPYGSSLTASNGTVQIGVPMGTNSREFFRLQAVH